MAAALFNDEMELADQVADCEDYVELTKALEADSEECSMFLQSEQVCCSPTPPENPCQFCPGGIDVEGSPTAAFLSEEQLAEEVASCEYYVGSATVLEKDSEECSLTLMVEQTCCPGQIEPPDNPCPFCQGGIDIEGSPFASSMDETMLAESVAVCEYLVDLAKVLEADSEECSAALLEGEPSCCSVQIENPCTMCAGATIDTSITIPEIGDCNTVVEIASATMSADGMECPFFQLFEAACCPIPATIPCSICPEGFTISGDAYVLDESGPTCSDVVTNTEEDSPACSATKDPDEGLISTCCVLQAGSGVTTPPVEIIPADNATLSPVASPPADEVPSPAPTEGPPTSAASSLLTSNVVIGPMTGILFVLAGFLLA